MKKIPNAVFSESGLFSMRHVGYIYGDWKDYSKPYHKIHSIFLDMKSVLRNYASNSNMQRELKKMIIKKKCSLKLKRLSLVEVHEKKGYLCFKHSQ